MKEASAAASRGDNLGACASASVDSSVLVVAISALPGGGEVEGLPAGT